MIRTVGWTVTLGWTVTIAFVAIAVVGCSAGQRSSSGVADEDSTFETSLSNKWEQVAIQFPDAIRPDVAIVRRIDIADWAPTMSSCLKDLGFIATVLPDGGIHYDSVAEAQLESRAVAEYTCQAKFPLKAKYLSARSLEQVEHIYEYFAGELSTCLEREGHPVSKPPSRQKFVDEYETPNSWNPYVEAMAGASQEEYYRVIVECPQFPSDLYG